MSSYPAGLELDCRIGAAVAYPVNLSNFSTSGLSSLFTTAYPSAPTSYPGYWNPILPYLLWGQLPPGYRVICYITIPPFSTDIATAQTAGGLVGYEGTSDDPVVYCNGLLAFLNIN